MFKKIVIACISITSLFIAEIASAKQETFYGIIKECSGPEGAYYCLDDGEMKWPRLIIYKFYCDETEYKQICNWLTKFENKGKNYVSGTIDINGDYENVVYIGPNIESENNGNNLPYYAKLKHNNNIKITKECVAHFGSYLNVYRGGREPSSITTVKLSNLNYLTYENKLIQSNCENGRKCGTHANKYLGETRKTSVIPVIIPASEKDTKKILGDISGIMKKCDAKKVQY